MEIEQANGGCIMERTNVISEYGILLKIEAIYKDAMKMKKRRTEQQFQDGLFDILICQCHLGDSACSSCPAGKRIPSEEAAFIKDQRTERKLHVGSSLDKETTSKRRQKETHETRKATSQRHDKSGNVEKVSPLGPTGKRKHDADSSSEECMQFSEEEWIPEDCEFSPCEQNRADVPNFSMMCDRYGISNRAGAALYNATLIDNGIIKAGECSTLMDMNKLHRQRTKWGKLEAQRTSEKTKVTGLKGVFYDGREDKTLVTSEGKTITKKQLHEVVVEEPGGQYVDHVTPASGGSADIAQELLDVIREHEGEPVVVGSDGTAVNTGYKSGVNRRLELALGRPLQQAICGIHTNELTLRHVFRSADGDTSGPNSFKGPLGKQVQEDLTHRPVEQYEAVSGDVPELPEETVRKLSADQKYLDRICHAIQSGSEHFPPDLGGKEPGALHQARWLTLANRCLRLYVSTSEPSPALIRIVQFILRQHAPGWFRLREFSGISDGARNFHFLVQCSRTLSDADKQIAQKVLQTNGYWAHGENILVAMLADERQEIREMAVDIILQCRQRPSDDIRQFRPPHINFNAEDYIQLVEPDVLSKCEPPLTMALSEEELSGAINAPLHFPYPCHSQGVERWVQEVTAASQNRVGHNSRHQWLLNRAKSRLDLPVIQTKKSFLDCSVLKMRSEKDVMYTQWGSDVIKNVRSTPSYVCSATLHCSQRHGYQL